MNNVTTPATAGSSSPDSSSATLADSAGRPAAADAPPIAERLIQRAANSAHEAVDSVAAKATALSDGLNDGVSKVGDTRDEWIAAARDAIRQHPFTAVAGALVIGAALLGLNSARRA